MRDDGQGARHSAYQRRHQNLADAAAERPGERRCRQRIGEADQQRAMQWWRGGERLQPGDSVTRGEFSSGDGAGDGVQLGQVAEVDIARRRDEQRAMLMRQRADGDLDDGWRHVDLGLRQVQRVRERQQQLANLVDGIARLEQRVAQPQNELRRLALFLLGERTIRRARLRASLSHATPSARYHAHQLPASLW